MKRGHNENSNESDDEIGPVPIENAQKRKKHKSILNILNFSFKAFKYIIK